MATPGEMVSTMALALRMPPANVGVFYRGVREAGLIKTGGRGRSAAQVSALDVARLLISIMTSEFVRDAPQSLHVFGDLRETVSEVDAVTPLNGARLGLGPGHRFEDAMVAVLHTLSQPAWQRPDAATQSPNLYRFGADVDITELQATLLTDKVILRYIHVPGSPGERDEEEYGLHVRKSLGGPSLRLLASLLSAAG